MEYNLAKDYRLGFGQHSLKPLSMVDSSYLKWAHSIARSSIKEAITVVLSHRGIAMQYQGLMPFHKIRKPFVSEPFGDLKRILEEAPPNLF